MAPIDSDSGLAFGLPATKPEGGQEPSHAELCSGFLSALAKSARNAILYGLNHPVVIESLGKAFSLLGGIFAETKEGSMTIAYANDAWLMNGIPVPAATQDAENLAAFFRGHGVLGATFLLETRLFELGVFCEFLGTNPKTNPPGYLKKFLAQRGVTGIVPETAHYVRETAHEPRAAEGPAATVRPRPEAVSPAPEATPRPEAATAEPALRAPEMRPVPQPKAAPAGMPRPGSSAAGTKPAAQPKAAAEPGGAQPPAAAPPGQALGALITSLVESGVKDPHERMRVYEDALRIIKQTIEKQLAGTTRALAEEKQLILNNLTRTEKVLANVADGKVIVDKEGRILMMNPAAEAIAGKRFSEVAGRPMSEHLKPGEHFMTLSDDMDLSRGAKLTGTVHVTGDDNVGMAMRQSMALLEDDEGRVVGAFATLPQIMKFREAQRLQEEFLSKVTHDLQSPLSSISSALEMLTDTAALKLTADERKFLDISVRNSLRLADMIRGILDFSKLQAGKLTVHPEAVPVGPIVTEAGEGLLPWARTKGISLIVRPPRPEVRALADHKRIVQVLTNLVSNAIKSTPKGGTVVVAGSRAANPDPSVIIGVRDTGCGMSKEDLGKLFQKFVQLESAGPREGVGLGLCIVAELIRLHGGKIWAESEPGKGATFYFTLPMAPPGQA